MEARSAGPVAFNASSTPGSQRCLSTVVVGIERIIPEAMTHLKKTLEAYHERIFFLYHRR
jgi:hypothetical protein